MIKHHLCWLFNVITYLHFTSLWTVQTFGNIFGFTSSGPIEWFMCEWLFHGKCTEKSRLFSGGTDQAISSCSWIRRYLFSQEQCS
jgi:hypothetical protein